MDSLCKLTGRRSTSLRGKVISWKLNRYTSNEESKDFYVADRWNQAVVALQDEVDKINDLYETLKLLSKPP